MPTTVDPASVLAEEAPTIRLPIDISEMASVASLQLFVTPMAKRLFWLRDRINNGVRRIRTATSIAAMRGLPATTGEFCFLMDESSVPVGLYVYSEGPFTMGWSEDKAPWQYASAYHSGAMWFSVLHQSIGGNTNSIAIVDENGRLTAKGPNAIRAMGFLPSQVNTAERPSTPTFPEITFSTSTSAEVGHVSVGGSGNDIVLVDAILSLRCDVSATVLTELRYSISGGDSVILTQCQMSLSANKLTVSMHGTFRVDPAYGSSTVRVAPAARLLGSTGQTVWATIESLRVQVVQP